MASEDTVEVLDLFEGTRIAVRVADADNVLNLWHELKRCRRCGALVDILDLKLHTEWHGEIVEDGD